MKKTSLITVTLGLLTAMASISRADLLINGGFETGAFNGWSVAGVSEVKGPAGSVWAHSGSFGAALGEGILSQSIATTAGHAYDVSFWMKAIPGGNPQLLTVTWDSSSTTLDYGAVVLGGLTGYNPITATGWAHYDFLVLALSTTGTLKFEFQTQAVTYPNNVAVDDASVTDSGMLYGLPILSGVPIGSPSPTLAAVSPYLISSAVTPDASPVPEPSTYGLLGAALLGGAIFWRRRKS